MEKGRLLCHQLNMNGSFYQMIIIIIYIAGCCIYNRLYCRKINPKFKACHNEITNLYPSISTINRFRGNLPFAEIPEKYTWYPFGKAIGFKKHINGGSVEPRDEVKPLIGATYINMEYKGCIRLTDEEYLTFYRWANNIKI